MKTLLFISMICFNSLAYSQCTLPYKSLSSFANDTTAFITYNFSTRAACYVGKTMKDVINDLKMPIQSYLTIEEHKGRVYTFHYNCICIYVQPYSIITQNLRKHIFDNWIVITLETPINSDDFDNQRDTERNKWTPQIEAYLSELKIKQISN